MRRKKVVYFNEYNVRMARATYFPLVSGILQAYAQTSPAIREGYEFKPFVFYLDSPQNVLAQYDEPPDVAAFSIAMWNEQLSLHIAREIKQRWPECLIVFGGAQLPHDPEDYFRKHPFIDVGVRAEGEEAFRQILERFLDSRDFEDVVNVSYRHPEDGRFVTSERVPDRDRGLDSYPSPYLEGLFDPMFETHPNIEFQAIIETNRGCPFLCTFCYWGRGGTTRKYRYHGLDRVEAEIDWCGRRGIRYVFNADSNFGMHKRDPDIAQFLVETKKRYGFPEKFRSCWGKNTDETIFRIASLLHDHDLEKGITLARQSNSKQVLANIKRGNIRLEAYANLQRLFNDREIPVYSEMILGLPGETYQSWRDGLQELLEAGLRNQLFVYQCEVYPNTDLGDPEYQKKFGVRPKRIELREIHGSVRDESWVPEYQEIITRTDAMSEDDWRRMTTLSTMTMLMHSMKVGFFLISYLTDRFGIEYMSLLEHICDRKMSRQDRSMLVEELELYGRYEDTLLGGGGRGMEMPEYGEIYWDVEEVSFLRLAEDLDRLYAELLDLVREFLDEGGISYDADELAEVVRYQRLRIPSATVTTESAVEFRHNLPEYFARRFGTSPISVQRERQRLELAPIDFGGDKRRFARETILWGRKSGTMLVSHEWSSLDRPWVGSRTQVLAEHPEQAAMLPRPANLGSD